MGKTIDTQSAPRLTEKQSFLFLWLGIAAYTIFLTVICLFQFKAFAYKDFDLAVHSQIIWNILHGTLYNSILGVNFLGHHVHPVSFLIAPLYVLFPHPVLLLFLQSLSLGLGAYPLYKLAKAVLGHGWALIIAIVYLSYPPLVYMNLYEFHPVALSTAFLLFALYYLHNDRFGKYSMFILLAVSCQENISLIAVGLGLYALLMRKRKVFVIFSILLGAAYFLLCIKVILPHFGKGTIQFLSLYQDFGGSYREILVNIAADPLKAVKIIFTRNNMIYLNQIFAPLLYLPILSPVSLLPSLPVFMQHLLSWRPQETSIVYHYGAEIIPFMFLGLVFGIKKILAVDWFRRNQLKLGAYLVLATLISNIFIGPYPFLLENYSSLFKRGCSAGVKESFLRLIPAGAKIVTSLEFISHLANRRNLFSFHHVYMGRYTLSSKTYRLPEDTEYALIDFSDSRTFDDFYLPERSSNIKTFIEGGGWGVLDVKDNVVLFQKNAKDRHRLYSVLEGEPAFGHKINRGVNKEIEMLGYDFESKGGYLHLSLYWKALAKTDKDINLSFDIVDKHDKIIRSFWMPMCYRIYPTTSWLPGERIRDDKYLVLPPCLPRGSYILRLSLFDYATGGIFGEGALDGPGKISIAEFNIDK